MDPMDYTLQQPSGPSAHSGGLHNHTATWMTNPHGHANQWPFHPAPYSHHFGGQRPSQNSPTYSHPQYAPPFYGLDDAASVPGRHVAGAAHLTLTPPFALGSWPASAPLSAPVPGSVSSQSLTHSYSGTYDASGMQSGWSGNDETTSRGAGFAFQSPPPATGYSRRAAGSRSVHSLPRLQTSFPPSFTANARSRSPRSPPPFSPSATPFTPGQERYLAAQQPRSWQFSREAGLGRSMSYSHHSHPQQNSNSPLHPHSHSQSPSVQRSSLPSPAPERARPRSSRPRRAFGSRYTASDPAGENSAPASARSSTSHRRPHSMSQAALEEVSARHMQVLRGAVTSKMVASKAALQSLQKVPMNDLADNEKSCVICYNDFGVETPEGVCEGPLRLPKCKHVFGDVCIKKWLEDSDSCPYCRDKLQSEPKHCTSSARTFMNIMRMRGLDLPQADAEDLYRRILSGDDLELPPTSSTPSQAERRPPPDAADDHQRRTRLRRSSSIGDSSAPLTPRNANMQRPQMLPTPPEAGRSSTGSTTGSTASNHALLRTLIDRPSSRQPVASQGAAAVNSARGNRRRGTASRGQNASPAERPSTLIGTDASLRNPLQVIEGIPLGQVTGAIGDWRLPPVVNPQANGMAGHWLGQNHSHIEGSW